MTNNSNKSNQSSKSSKSSNSCELDSMAIGRRIMTARLARNMTREALAEKMDKSVQFISAVEYGNRGLSIASLYSACQALEVTADYIMAMGTKKGTAIKGETPEAKELREQIAEILCCCQEEWLPGILDMIILFVRELSKKQDK